MRNLATQQGFDDVLDIDSAGTGGWHVGHSPDARASAAAKRRGILLTSRARRVEVGDFSRFDYMVAMDRDNRAELLKLAPDPRAESRVSLLRDYDPIARVVPKSRTRITGAPMGLKRCSISAWQDVRDYLSTFVSSIDCEHPAG